MILLALLMVAAAYTWKQFYASGAAVVQPYLLVGGVGGFVIGIITVFKKTWAPVTAPLYAVLKGLLLGGLSALFETRFPGIGFSLFVVVIAALNLVLDFDFIENGAERAAPKYMEWYGAFGILVTLVWLYIEILRLLAKIRSR